MPPSPSESPSSHKNLGPVKDWSPKLVCQEFHSGGVTLLGSHVHRRPVLLSFLFICLIVFFLNIFFNIFFHVHGRPVLLSFLFIYSKIPVFFVHNAWVGPGDDDYWLNHNIILIIIIILIMICFVAVITSLPFTLT